jgi:SAM-dependent MidA family methyltransferase
MVSRLTGLSHILNTLPSPPPDAQQHSQQLVRLIQSEIAARGGWMGFDQFMALALYAPGMGYYSAGLEKFGAMGDFVTAPEISPFFGRCIARQAAQVLEKTGGDILELGAGSGRLALDVLTELEALGKLPERYLILEVSPDLRKRQKEFLDSSLDLRISQKVEWIDAIPARFYGLVLANEVLDALPVHLVRQTAQGLLERGVVCAGDGFAWSDRPLEEGELKQAAAELKLPQGYLTEINLAGRVLVASLADSLQSGMMLLVDYGFPRREFYHAQRETGTLMCHYRQMAHDDPFWFPGLQDITAHVDFTAIAEVGVAQGLRLAGYTTQARFLMNCGITALLEETSPQSPHAYLPRAAEVQKLLSPAEMGELFKVMAFSRDLELAPMGFSTGDQSFRL